MNAQSSCLFCRIISGETKSDLVYQDDDVVAFNDINPQAPHHTLICPRKHIPTLNEIAPDDEKVIGHAVRKASDLARELGDDQEGYRVVVNCQEGAGQSVFHVHLHLLGGRRFRWPPG